jgi:hypothetical protein
MAFLYHDEPLIVAIRVGKNGYVVSMNPKSRFLLEEYGVKVEDLNRWPL